MSMFSSKGSGRRPDVHLSDNEEASRLLMINRLEDAAMRLRMGWDVSVFLATSEPCGEELAGREEQWCSYQYKYSWLQKILNEMRAFVVE